VAALVEMEDRPWGEWKHGRPMTPISVARLLKPFGIRPRNFKAAGQVLKGYDREPIMGAFDRYCHNPGTRPATPLPSSEIKDLDENRPATKGQPVAAQKHTKPLKSNDSSGVATQNARLPDEWRDFE